jgi:hypothetical protein
MDATKRTLALVSEIDADELAVRIIETLGGMKRPPGNSAAQALAGLPAEDRAAAKRAAVAAMTYIRDCINAGQRPT